MLNPTKNCSIPPTAMISPIASQATMRCCIYLVAAVIFLSFAQPYSVHAQKYHPTLRWGTDSDGDGLSDALEQALLRQFAPHFRVSRSDCSNDPAEFVLGLRTPRVRAESGTIYGQAFPVKNIHLGRACRRNPLLSSMEARLWRERTSIGRGTRVRSCPSFRL
jgi:hypothetical protein